MRFLKIESKYFPFLPAILALLLYGITLGHGYVYDDEIVILENTHVQDGFSGISKIWQTNYLNGHDGYNDGLYRPLSPSMFAIEVALFGNNPMIGHLMNILFYALLCSVVFLFIRELSGGNQLLALFVSLIYAAHPIHTEVVANIKSRDELMAALFGFSALYFYAKKSNIDFKLGLLVSALFLLALFSKESAIAYLAIFPIVYYFKNGAFQKQFYIYFSLVFGMSIAWYMLRGNIIDSMPNAIDDGLFSQLSNSVLLAKNKLDQLATGLWIVLIYVYKSIIPYPLVNDYSPNVILPIAFFSFQNLLSVLLLGAVFFAGIFFAYKKSLKGFGLLFFLILLAPVSNVFIPIGTTIGERLAFAPSLGIVLFAVSALSKWKAQISKNIFLAIILLFSVLSVQRALEWESNFTLFKADVEKHPESFRTNYNYGTELNKSVGTRTGEELSAQDRKNLETSIQHFKKTVEIKPLYADVTLNMGNAYRRLGNVKEALKCYDYLIKNKPDYTKAIYNKAVTYFEIEDYQNAHDVFIQYTESNGPMQGLAWYSAGVCSGYLANFDQAILELENSIATDAAKWNAWEFLGMAYGNIGKWDKAANAFENAYKINPDPSIKEKWDRAKAPK